MSFTILSNSFIPIEHPKKHGFYEREYKYRVRNLDGSEYDVTHSYEQYTPGHKKKKKAFLLTPDILREIQAQANCIEKIAHKVNLTAAEAKFVKKESFLKYSTPKRVLVKAAPKAIVLQKPVVKPPAELEKLIAESKEIQILYKTAQDKLAIAMNKHQLSNVELNRVQADQTRLQAQQAVIKEKLRAAGINI